MDKIYEDDEFYEIIKNEGENEEKRINHKKKHIRIITLKEKIIYKYIIKKISLFKLFIILFILIFICVYYFQKIDFFYNNSLKNAYKILFNITESQNVWNKSNENENKKNNIEEFDSINESYKKSIEFLKKCLEGEFIQNPSNFISSDNPKVSVVIPVYNSGKFINRAIKSIQNQDLLDLEIILINDFSKDDTLSIIENIQKEDSRIKIIKNQKNMGIIYSRSIGSLSAKGKYIFPLDNDDMFLDKDVFTTITNIAELKNIDLVEFKGVSVSNRENLFQSKISDRAFSDHKLNAIIVQPELGDYPLRAGNEIGQLIFKDVYLWAKCIKTEIYKKALNNIGTDRYTRYMIGHEDVVVNFILFNTAESFIFIGKYGIFRVYRQGSANKETTDINQNLKNLYLADIVIHYLKNSNERTKLVYYLIYNVLNLPLLKTIWEQSEYNRKLLKSCLDRFFNCSYISRTYKELIKKKVKIIKYIDYKF